MLQSVSKGKLKPNYEELINIGNKKIEVLGSIIAEEGMEILNAYPFKSKKGTYNVYQKLMNFNK